MVRVLTAVVVGLAAVVVGLAAVVVALAMVVAGAGGGAVVGTAAPVVPAVTTDWVTALIDDVIELPEPSLTPWEANCWSSAPAVFKFETVAWAAALEV